MAVGARLYFTSRNPVRRDTDAQAVWRSCCDTNFCDHYYSLFDISLLFMDVRELYLQFN